MQTDNFLDSPIALCSHDPLVMLLLRVTRRKVIFVALIALAIYGFLWLALGSLISIYYTKKGTNFVSILDTRELPIAILVCAVYSAIWTFYVWQPVAMNRVFDLFIEKDLIERQQVKYFQKYFTERVVMPINKSSHSKLILICVLVAVITYTQLYDPVASDPLTLGLIKWWYVDYFYYIIVWLPSAFINFYMVFWIIIRQIHLILKLRELYQNFKIQTKLFHPDGCNGFEQIGEFSIRSSLMCLIFGFWIFFFISYPVLIGQQINIKNYMGISLIMYTLIVPVTLISPIWSTRVIMDTSKRIYLENIAKKIRFLLLYQSIGEIHKNSAIVENITKRYNLIEREHHTWPFRRIVIARFLVAAIVPIIGSITTYLVDLMFKRP